MAVVTATHQRSEVKDVYVPPGMAHRSFVSPDQRWVLIASSWMGIPLMKYVEPPP